MQVREIMSKDVQVVSPDDILQHAAKLMTDSDAGALPMGEDDRLVGMLTDHDTTVRAVAQGKTPDRCEVRDVMSHEVKFEPFWRKDERGPGTDLGLAIVCEIARLHGGTASVDETPGGGATFRLHLPALSGADHGAPPSRHVHAV